MYISAGASNTLISLFHQWYKFILSFPLWSREHTLYTIAHATETEKSDLLLILFRSVGTLAPCFPWGEKKTKQQQQVLSKSWWAFAEITSADICMICIMCSRSRRRELLLIRCNLPRRERQRIVHLVSPYLIGQPRIRVFLICKDTIDKNYWLTTIIKIPESWRCAKLRGGKI